MTETEITVDQAITDAEVELLNEARTILTAIAKRCGAATWGAGTEVMDEGPSAADYGRVDALAHTAENAIFTVLNWANSHRVRPLTEVQLHGAPKGQG